MSKEKNPSLLSLVSTSKKKGHLISEDNSGMKETRKPEPLKTYVAMKNHQHFKTEYFHSTLNEIEASETDL